MTVAFQCTLCSGREFSLIFRKAQWTYRRCHACGLVHLHPRPTAGQAVEAYTDYLSSDPQKIARWQHMMQPVIQQSANLIQSRCPTTQGYILDIGCGYGFFLAEMARRGWSVQGMEISPAGRHYARQTLHLSVTDQPLEAQPWPQQSFDVITLFYVIEHLLDPKAMLAQVHCLLKPGGLLLLRWPHSTPIVRLLGPLARYLDLYHTPFHLYDFSPHTMTLLLTQCGYTSLTTCIGGYTLPTAAGARLCSKLFGMLAEHIQTLTRSRYLLPGMSKTTLAVKS